MALFLLPSLGHLQDLSVDSQRFEKAFETRVNVYSTDKLWTACRPQKGAVASISKLRVLRPAEALQSLSTILNTSEPSKCKDADAPSQ